MSIDISNHKDQVEKYKSQIEIYKTFSKILEKILIEAKKDIDPSAIIQIRTKSISSFAEKVIRKAGKYSNPVEEFTDLSGARIITNTLYEVDKFCDFIEETFVVDRENSLDVKSRLKVNEFGYLSVHYIINLSASSLFGVEIPEEIRNKKAEIQVRTLLQHAWSEVDHDRLYKGGFKIPEEIIRENKRLAAVMENADKDFLNLATKLDEMKSNYVNYMNAEKRKDELKILDILLENSTNTDNTLEIIIQITKLLKADSDWKRIINILEPLMKQNIKNNILVQQACIELSYAFCKLCNKDIEKNLEKCRGYVEPAINSIKDEIRDKKPAHKKLYPKKYLLLAQGLKILAETYQIEGYHKEAKKYYLEAYSIDSSNPYIFAKCLEFETFNSNSIPLLIHSLNSSLELCEAHIKAGMELSNAYFARARFKYVLKEYEESLIYYIEAINYCRINDEKNLEDIIKEEKRFISNWGATDIDAELEKRIIEVLNIANNYFKLIKKKDVEDRTFNKLVLAGGLEKDKNIKNLEYLSSFIKDYNNEIVHDDPVKYFNEIINSGRNPEKVLLICMSGDKLTIFELKLALALGATVVITNENSNLSLEIKNDDAFISNRNLIIIPSDEMTIRAVINTFFMKEKSVLDNAQIEIIAQKIHNNYLEENKNSANLAMQPWNELDESFKNSNKNQAEFYSIILSSCGYGIRKANNELVEFQFSDEEIEIMAEIEHGRWNCERLMDGWKFSEKKDVKKKLSPWLIEWNKLPGEIKKYDRDAIQGYCKNLKELGYEVYKIEKQESELIQNYGEK